MHLLESSLDIYSSQGELSARKRDPKVCKVLLPSHCKAADLLPWHTGIEKQHLPPAFHSLALQLREVLKRHDEVVGMVVRRIGVEVQEETRLLAPGRRAWCAGTSFDEHGIYTPESGGRSRVAWWRLLGQHPEGLQKLL